MNAISIAKTEVKTDAKQLAVTLMEFLCKVLSSYQLDINFAKNSFHLT